MNIIFGQDEAQALSEKYTVLKLDVIRVGATGPEVPAYCVIENLPITELTKVPSMRDLHENLMVHYYKQDWKYCLDAIEQLQGFWGKEVDSFYENLQQRINKYQENDPGPNWDPVIQK
jgi:hypothetical protein